MAALVRSIIALLLLLAVSKPTMLDAAPLDIRGIDLFPFNSTVLESHELLVELDEIVAIGANTVALNWMLQQENATSNQVNETPRTPTMQSLLVFIAAAKKRNLSVFLKPLIVCGENCLMFNITPSDPEAWFTSYSNYMLAIAEIAQLYNVEYLSIGLELARMTINPIYLPYWRSFISRMRNSFSGMLTYCSIYFPYETQRVLFWDMLDFISSDTYVPLMNATASSPPTLAQMTAIFTAYLSSLSAWHQAQPANVSSLPIVFSEVGYPSSVAGLITPSTNPPAECNGTATPDFGLQAQAFQAYFTTQKSQPWLQGTVIFWFDNPSTDDYEPNEQNDAYGCGWTVRGKPAEQVIQTAFRTTTTTTTTTK